MKRKNVSFVRKEIEAIYEVIKELTMLVTSKEAVSPQQIHDARQRLNIHLIQAMTGCEIVTTSDANATRKLKAKHALPTSADIAEVMNVLERYVNCFETPYLQRSAAALAQSSNTESTDMSTDVAETLPEFEAPADPKKVSYKEINALLLGGENSYLNANIGPADCMKIASWGEKARQRRNIKLVLVIGGITLVAVGSVAYVQNKKKDETETDEDVDVDVDDDDIDVDEDDIDIDDIDPDLTEADVDA